MTDGAARARRPRSVRQDWFFAFALALFVGVTVWFGRQIQDFLSPPSRSIGAPTLVGQTLADAYATAQRTGVKAYVVQRVTSDRYPRDVVMRQDPPPGAQVRQGRQISLVVSTGVSIFAMPDLRYESLREVGLDLSHDKLQLGKVKVVPSANVPANRVVDQDPAPLTSVRAGSVVNIEISRGGPQAIRVPGLTGITIDDARAQAQAAHVQIGQIVWTPFGRYGPARGIVVRQSPAFNAVIGPDDPVSLQVSAGPREAGYLIRQVHATATVPEDAALTAGKSPSVRVSVSDETGTWNVYDAFAEPKQKLDFNLTVVGTAELDVFVNNELVDSTKLGKEPELQERQQLGAPPKGSHPPKDVLNPNATPSGSPAPQLRTTPR
ncbi:MAG: PASTA domain-containing protein [Candidatus Eremiobacteraeota bacterium]|nr:PASTA domain-containing protein [Candidatus Eremiobacteraeota bacterium]